MRIPKHSCLLAVLILLWIVNSSSPCMSQGNKAARQAYRNQLAQRWAWATEAWTGADGPYRQIMSDVDQAVAGRGDLERLLTQYKLAAGKNRADPEVQFRWAYLAYRMSILPENADKGVNKVGLSLNALEHAPSPHSYLYDRMHYLALHLFTSDYHMQYLGLRLLKRDPGNNHLMLAYIHDLSDERDDVDRSKMQVVTDQSQALVLANRYVSRYPEDPDGYSALGLVYSLIYLSNNSPTDQASAVAAFNEELKHTSPGSNQYQIARQFIKKLKGGLVRFNGQYVYRETMPR